MSNTKKLVITGLMSALMCVLSPFSLPLFGGIGLSLGIMVVLFMAYVLELPMGTISCGIYILLGIVGLPVFAGFSGGIGVLLGPTGGFIGGYIILSLIAGIFVKIGKGNRLVFFGGALFGLLCCYLLGTLWYMHVSNVSFVPAITVCVLPYVIFDIVKIVIVCILGPILKKNIK